MQNYDNRHWVRFEDRMPSNGAPGRRYWQITDAGLDALLRMKGREDMLKQTILIEPMPKQGSNGDRATTLSLYFDYRVHVLNLGEEPSDETVVHTVWGYNNFHSSIRPDVTVRSEVETYAVRLRERLGFDVEWDKEDCGSYHCSVSQMILARTADEASEIFMDRVRSGKITAHVREDGREFAGR
jgi:hypothetical protein